MKDEWFHRLERLISEDGRSFRQLSEAANCGPNFVQQLLKTRKDPRASQLSRLLEALGPEATLYVTTGIRMSEDDLTFLQLVSSLDAGARRDAVALLQRLASLPTAEQQDRGELDQARSTNESIQ